MKQVMVFAATVIGMVGCASHIGWGDEACSYQALQQRLKRLHMGIESTLQYGQEENETVFYDRYEPIKAFPVQARRRFRTIITEALKRHGYPVDADHVRRLLPVLQPDDVRDVGCLRYQADFDIVLNRYLHRSGITPATPEQVDIFLDDVQKAVE